MSGKSKVQCVLTYEQEQAMILVNECFVSSDPHVAIQFCRFLVEKKHGLPWLDEQIGEVGGLVSEPPSQLGGH